jgi:DNA-binding PadR family transcriptional regulator
VQKTLAWNKRKGTELAVLKGRKTDLTNAIFQILSKEALVKYDLHKKILDQGFKDTHYGTIKKKIKILEEIGYLEQVGVRKHSQAAKASFIKQLTKHLQH